MAILLRPIVSSLLEEASTKRDKRMDSFALSVLLGDEGRRRGERGDPYCGEERGDPYCGGEPSSELTTYGDRPP